MCSTQPLVVTFPYLTTWLVRKAVCKCHGSISTSPAETFLLTAPQVRAAGPFACHRFCAPNLPHPCRPALPPRPARPALPGDMVKRLSSELKGHTRSRGGWANLTDAEKAACDDAVENDSNSGMCVHGVRNVPTEGWTSIHQHHARIGPDSLISPNPRKRRSIPSSRAQAAAADADAVEEEQDGDNEIRQRPPQRVRRGQPLDSQQPTVREGRACS